MRGLLVVALLALPCVPADAGCQSRALSILRTEAPDGYAIYRAASQPRFFLGWVDCEAAQLDLATAVHETTHLVTGATDAFPLVGGGEVARPHEISGFMPPWRIAGRFGHDGFTDVYLARDKASAAGDALYLLDELNAYTHDLQAAVDLKTLAGRDETVDHRDGLAALMAFVSVYAETARAEEPATWEGLQAPRPRAIVATLWRQAERVMAGSCGIPRFGVLDRDYIARVCTLGPSSAMAALIGRAPACPTTCLAPEPDDAPDEAASDAVTGSLAPAGDGDEVAAPRHPFALHGRHE